MMKDWTHIAVVLDRSGSMGSVKEQTIDGFDEFVNGQKLAGDNASLTLTQFDDEYEIVWNDKPIKDVPSIKDIYQPRGLTALLDAIGRTINSVGKNLSEKSEDERPNKVIFVILTDGLENASKEFTREKIFKMIRHQEEVYKWEFVFLGANQDAISVGRSFGVKTGSSANYGADNVKGAFKKMSDKAGQYRVMSASQCSALRSGQLSFFSDEDREDLK